MKNNKRIYVLQDPSKVDKGEYKIKTFGNLKTLCEFIGYERQYGTVRSLIIKNNMAEIGSYNIYLTTLRRGKMTPRKEA